MSIDENDYILDRIEFLKKEYPSLRNIKDYRLFILVGLKYFFFSDSYFDPEYALQEYVTDGANDGGIDAVFNDPTSSNNDMIIVQSKYYEESPLNDEAVTAELIKISDTIKNIDNCKVSEYNDTVVSAYRNAKSSMSEEGEIKIVFLTSYQPKNKKSRTKIESFIRNNFHNYSIDIDFRSDINDQIDMIDNAQAYVDHDELLIDKTNNYLEYEDSIIVNVSAKSLQDLSIRRRNGLLGMNLRYFVKKKEVDSGIDETIKKHAVDFWYKNNGLVIVCQNWRLDGNHLKLDKFSVVNGGQTTYRIAHSNIENDFYVQCKVVQSKGNSDEEKDRFVTDIAKATNSQKKIDIADIKANTPEQLKLREKLSHEKVYYIIKRGDKIPKKQYSEPYQAATMKEVGKIGLAAVLQMPGSARSNPARMFQDEYYNSIYGKESQAKVIADALKLEYYYTLYIKNELKDKGYDETTVLPMFRNGTTYQLACITFLCKVINNVFAYEDISSTLSNPDLVKSKIRVMGDMDRLFSRKLDDEKDYVYSMFSVIGEEVLGYCYGNALENAEGDLVPSNYLKSDNNYYKDIIKRLWSRYNSNKTLKDAANILFS